MSSSEPLSRSESGPEYDSEHEAVVCVRRDFCDSVTDKDGFVGRLSVVSRLPQYLVQYEHEAYGRQHIVLFPSAVGRSWRTYLMTAMFTGAVVLAL